MAMFAQVLSLRYILYFDIDPLLLLKGEMFLMIFFYVPIPVHNAFIVLLCFFTLKQALAVKQRPY